MSQQQQVRVIPPPTMPAMTAVPAMTAAVPGSERSAAVTISSEVLVAAIVFLFMVVVFVFFLYLYARRYLGPNPLLRRARSGAARLVFASDLGGASAAAPSAARRGLDPAALAALPVVVVGSRAGKEEEAMECAVCLCEVGEGEEARLLPKCNHGFHVECIDMWLHSHTTCPLCRSPVGGAAGFAGLSPRPAAEGPAPEPAEPPVFPTNVLFWGTQDRINAGSSSEPSSSSSSSSSRARGHNELVIEIPRRAMDGSPSPISPLPVSRMSAEEMKSPSPAPPSSARLRSLRRLLSRGRQATATGSSCSPRGGDVEQGTIGGGAATPRTPRTPTN